MSKCKLYAFCGIDDQLDAESLCILHSPDPKKDVSAFKAALVEHRKIHGDTFFRVVFPCNMDFREDVFAGDSSFQQATFLRDADFVDSRFLGIADFSHSTFRWSPNFASATFSKNSDFGYARFHLGASFSSVVFRGRVSFSHASFENALEPTPENMFHKRVSFERSQFCAGADFQETSFRGVMVAFNACSFQERTLFTAREEMKTRIPVFGDALYVDFQRVAIDPPEAVSYQEADFQNCSFLDTDMRKVGLIGVVWPRSEGRYRVPDDREPLCPDEARPWSRIERQYRDIRLNYEDRKDFERAGDFHLGEKEMRLRNPVTPRSLKIVLRLYKFLSLYGERWSRPLVCALILIVLCAAAYLFLGISTSEGTSLSATHIADWLRALHFSLRTAFLVRTSHYVLSEVALPISTLESAIAPFLFALCALALRQRLKR